MAARQQLVVEGEDDLHFFVHLLRAHNIPLNEPSKEHPNRILIENGRGVSNILESLTIRVRVLNDDPEQNCLGIVLDADLDVAQRWQSLRDRLQSTGYSIVPEAPVLGGVILSEESLPRLGVWLMPNNQLPGELEDFVATLVPQGDRLWSHAEDSVAQITAEQRLFPPHDQMKALIHTWLAWQAEPGKPMGQAITKRFFRLMHQPHNR